jgi:multiple RNA-binding domain-containing protein 1
MNER